jgi:choline O-acetyltransferase
LFVFFQALPKVPVPPLEQTMAEYLRAIKPITTAQQYDKTEKIVKQFSVNPGPKIYEYLVEKREAEDNWVSEKFEFIFIYSFVVYNRKSNHFYKS